MDKYRENLSKGSKTKIKTMYLKLLVTYLPLVIVAIFLTAFLLSYLTNNYVSEEMDKNRVLTLKTNAKVVDSRFENILDAMFQIVINQSMIDLSGMEGNPSGEDVFVIRNIANQLSITMACDPMISDIFVFAPNINGIITTHSRRESELYIASKYPNNDAAKVLNEITECEQRSFFYTPMEEGNILTLVVSMPLISMDPKLYLCVILKPQEIKNSSDIVFEEDEDFMITTLDNYVLFEYDESNKISSKDIAENSSDLSDISIYEFPSSQLDISYIYLAEHSFFKKHFIKIILIAFIISSIIGILVIFYVLFFSKKIYKPISYLLALFDNEKAIGRTENDIMLIQNNVKSLITNNNKLSNYIKTIEPYVLDRILKKILMANINEGEQKLVIEELEKRLSKESILVCLVKIENYRKLEAEYSEMLFVGLKSKIANEYEKGINVFAETFVLIDKNQIVLVTSCENEDEITEQIKNEFSKIQKNIFEESGISTSAIIGTAFKRNINDTSQSIVWQIQRSYDIARILFERLFFSESKRQIIYKKVLLETKSDYYSFPVEKRVEIEEHLKLGQSKQAIDIMNDLININLKKSKYNYDNMQKLLNEFLLLAAGIVSEEKDLLFKTKDQIINEYPVYSTIYDCSIYVKNIFIKIGEHFKNKNSKLPLSKEEVFEYISENYKTDFGVQEISDHFHISKSYFNSIFKEMLNTTFHDFLIEYRINKAKELILNERCSLKEIASNTGFNEYRTFVRCFQKYAYCTPGEFKKKHM